MHYNSLQLVDYSIRALSEQRYFKRLMDNEDTTIMMGLTAFPQECSIIIIRVDRYVVRTLRVMIVGTFFLRLSVESSDDQKQNIMIFHRYCAIKLFYVARASTVACRFAYSD